MSPTEAILQALAALLAGDPFFPVVDVDEPTPTTWREAPAGGLVEGLADAVNLIEGAAPAVLRDGGVDDDFELSTDPVIAYAVQGRDRADRRARRDEAKRRIVALIRQDPTLGLGPQTFCEITGASADDNVAIEASAPAATILVALAVTFTADSPAG